MIYLRMECHFHVSAMEMCSSHLLTVCFMLCLINYAICRLDVQVSSLLEGNTNEN
jgi:hypothetical protein